MLHVQNIAQQNVNNTQTDGKGNVTTYEYNVANKPTKKIDHGGIKTVEGKITYEPNKTETYTYYSNAQMATKTDRNGKITNYKYDIHARLLSKTIDKEEVSYSYDSNGNQLAMTDTTGTTTRIYDELGRVISKSVPNLGATTFQYDILVNSKTIPELTSNYTIPEGSTAEKSKDPKSNETTKVSDGAGRLVFVISEGKVTSYTYDANGNRATVVYPDGKTKETYQYYRDNRLKKLTNTRANGSVMDEYSYTYDGAHNQTSKTEKINGTLKGTTSYTYDSLNRLAEVLEPKKTTETRGKLTKYIYDAAGNRETEQITTSTAAGTQVTVSTYKYNEQNRLLSTTEETVDGTKKTTTYSYDPNGNMTKKSFEQTRQIDPSNPPTPKFGMYIKGQQDGATENAKPIAAGTASYEYDVWNQLVKASTGDGSSTYKYNGEGYRTEKTENGVLTRSLYEADKVILETDKNGKETARNIYGTTLISRTVTTTENGTTQKDQYNYMYNGHADVTALLTADGTIVASYYYDAFGTASEKNENKGINNPYRYAGYVYDSSTNLYYLNARYYDSKIARFMSEDTYTGDENHPLSLNLYTYCHNEPVNYSDPSGHVWMYNAGGILQDVDPKDVNGASQVGYTIAKGVTMYNAGGIPCQVSSNDIYNAQRVGFTLPQVIYKDTDTVNINAGGLVNLSNINNLNIGNGTVSIDNRGSIGVINSGINSKTNIINNGYIGAFNTGIKSTNDITNNGIIGMVITGLNNTTTFSGYGYTAYAGGSGKVYYYINNVKVSAEIYNKAKLEAQKQIDKILAQRHYGFWHNGGYYLAEDTYAYLWYEQLQTEVQSFKFKKGALGAAIVPVSIYEAYKQAKQELGPMPPLLMIAATAYVEILDGLGLSGPESPDSVKDNLELLESWVEKSRGVATALAKFNFIMKSDYQYLMQYFEGRGVYKNQLKKLIAKINESDYNVYNSAQDNYVGQIYIMNDDYSHFSKLLSNSLKAVEKNVSQVEVEKINDMLK